MLDFYRHSYIVGGLALLYVKCIGFVLKVYILDNKSGFTLKSDIIFLFLQQEITNMDHGIVKWFDSAKGLKFIEQGDGKDVLAHHIGAFHVTGLNL